MASAAQRQLTATLLPDTADRANGRLGRGPSVRRPAGFRVLPPLGMPLSAGSSQSEPARQVLPAAGRSWPEAAVCTAEWVSLKLMTRVIITVLLTPPFLRT